MNLTKLTFNCFFSNIGIPSSELNEVNFQLFFLIVVNLTKLTFNRFFNSQLDKVNFQLICFIVNLTKLIFNLVNFIKITL